MSGIVGIVNLDGAPVDRALLTRLTHQLAPRGPDAQDIWIDEHVGFGHALLRTTFESETERQPFTLDGTLCVTADCRVDARDDLIRAFAPDDRAAIIGAPDAEVLLRAYAQWGARVVDHVLGDFALAIWDRRHRTLFCARDHLGIKAFFYCHVGDTFVFSNDLNCLRHHPAIPHTLDEVTIADRLMFGYGLDLDRTSFASVRRLPPGHTLTICDGRVSLSRYWQFPLEDELRYARREDYIDQFHALLDIATRDRLRTNRVGVYMSGGLDSPTVAATAHRLLSQSGSAFDLRAYTVVYDRLVPDEERKYATLAAGAIGIPIHFYPMDDDGLPPPEPDAAAWCPPEPWGVFEQTILPAEREPTAISRVFLRGEGMDPFLYATASALEKDLRDGQYGRLARDFLWLLWRRRQVPRLGIRTVMGNAAGRRFPTKIQPYPEWLAPDLVRRLDLRRRWLSETSPTDQPSGFELGNGYWPLRFEMLDPGTLGLAAEYRYPFVDLRLGRFLLRLPPIPWAIEKSLLRIALQGVLPSQVLRRPKAPVAGNPWARLLPPAHTRWWERYLAPAAGLEAFVDVKAANATIARVTPQTQAVNDHEDIDALRSSLRPIGLNRWLRQISL